MAPPAVDYLHPGLHQLGRYRLLVRLDSGGMADVYLATSLGLAGFTKLCVIKVLRRDYLNDPDHVAMFLSEARLAARLNHPNVVQTFEVGEDGGAYYLVMEYLEGQTLRRLTQGARAVERARSLPLLLRVLADALAGLHYAHELCDFDGTPLGVVHRDVSPHNLFVTYDGQIKLVDFGIAKLTDAAQRTRTGVVKGKVAYMAPEHACSAPVDRRADVFSAGAVLYEIVTGQRMWQGVLEVAVLQRLTSGAIPSARALAPEAPESLLRICDRALAHDPARRFATASDLREALEACLAEQGWRAAAADVGALLVELFGEQRASLRQHIDVAVASGSGPRTLPGLSSNPPTPGTNASTWLSHTLGPPRSGQTIESSGAPPRRAPPAAARLGLLALAGAVCAGGAFVAYRSRALAPASGAPRADAPAAAAAPAPPADSSPRAAPAPVATTVTARLSARPAEAKLYLDGRPLEGNPHQGTFPRGGTHELRAEAAGHRPVTRSISFDGDVAVDVVLSRAPAAHGPGGAPARKAPAEPRTNPPQAAPPTAELARDLPPPPTKRPVQPIDTESPYVKP